MRKTGPTLYESAKELARNIEAALNEQSRKTTSAVSAFQQNSNTTRYEQKLDKLASQFDKMQASLSRIENQSRSQMNFRHTNPHINRSSFRSDQLNSPYVGNRRDQSRIITIFLIFRLSQTSIVTLIL